MRHIPNWKLSRQRRPQIENPNLAVQQKEVNLIGPLATTQLEAFYSISFTHHILLLNLCKKADERFFYIEHSATQFWSVNIMENQIDADLFKKQGKLPNNFQTTISESLKPSALKVFKDEYLLDFIADDELNDERHIEQQVVSNISNFILQMGKGFCFIGNQYRLGLMEMSFLLTSCFLIVICKPSWRLK